MSLTSYRAAPPRGGELKERIVWKTWRRPTLPWLEPQYHGRWGFSRPSSGWDRVRAPRQSHQVVQAIRFSYQWSVVSGQKTTDEQVPVSDAVCRD